MNFQLYVLIGVIACDKPSALFASRSYSFKAPTVCSDDDNGDDDDDIGDDDDDFGDDDDNGDKSSASSSSDHPVSEWKYHSQIRKVLI
jgi:hypothetical protein